MKVYIPAAKAEQILELLNVALAADTLTAKDVQSLAGTLLSLNPGVRLPKLYCRSLYAALTNAPLDRSGPVVPCTTLEEHT